MKTYYGWGRKKSGLKAIRDSKKNKNSNFILREDGFIRSIGLGKSRSFSIVEDDIGIYYDSRKPSRLEEILNNYDFVSDKQLMQKASEALELIKKLKISKYNNGILIDKHYFKGSKKDRILVIDQKEGDLSLKYGDSQKYDIQDIVEIAISENPNSEVYLKKHPDTIYFDDKRKSVLNKINKKCKIIYDNVNAISLLEHFSKIYTRTSQMGFEALIMGCECVVFGMPFYSGWGLTDDRVNCERRKRKLLLEEVFAASYILYSKYTNPYRQKESNIIDTIITINQFKDLEKKTNKSLFLFGFSKWKHKYIYPFLKEFDRKKIKFINPLSNSYIDCALRNGLSKDSKIYIWGSKSFPFIENYAKENNIKITRVEDGFIRSIGLGSDLTRPLSLVFDDLGIHYDPYKESKLEKILNKNIFNKQLLLQAEKLVSQIIKTRISKYNYTKNINYKIKNSPDQKIILVIGQVEDDASIKFGGYGMNNLELLKKVKNSYPNDYIVYKSHPDVISGTRKGEIPKKFLQKLCDLSLNNVNVNSLISVVDEIHTITSLVGFESLLQGKKVVTYGLPFYAGWGLTDDKINCKRRKRKLKLLELVAGSLILYPRYIDPNNLEYCLPELLIDRISERGYRLKHNLGYIFLNKIRNLIVRTLQKIYKNR